MCINRICMHARRELELQVVVRLPTWFLEMGLGPLQEQYFLSAAPSLQPIRGCLFLGNKNLLPGRVVHSFYPSTREAEADSFLGSRTTEPYRETLSWDTPSLISFFCIIMRSICLCLLISCSTHSQFLKHQIIFEQT